MCVAIYNGTRVDAHLWNLGAACLHSFAVRNKDVKKIVSVLEPSPCYKNLDLKLPQKFGKGIFAQRRNGEGFGSVVR
jgi:hypothetical protein